MTTKTLCLSFFYLLVSTLLLGAPSAASSPLPPPFPDSPEPGDEPLLVAYLEQEAFGYELESLLLTFQAGGEGFVSEELPWAVFGAAFIEDELVGIGELALGSVTVAAGNLLPAGSLWVDVPNESEAWIEVPVGPLVIEEGMFLVAVETTANKMLSLDRPSYDALGAEPTEHFSYYSQDGGTTWYPLTEEDLLNIVSGLFVVNSNYLELQNRGNP